MCFRHTLEPLEDLQVELRLVASGEQGRTLESFVCEGDTMTSCMMGNWEGQPLVELLFPFVTRRDLRLSEVVVRVSHNGCEQTYTIGINENTVADPAPNAYTLRLADAVLVDPCG